MENFSRSPSLIQARSASPLQKRIDLSSPTPKFSSPSDFCKKSFELKNFSVEKENEQDPAAPKPIKGRSPVMTSSPKGPPFQKNFMAPTISASSKAVGSSCQRKRVLGERNDMVRSSYTSPQTETIAGTAVRFPLLSTQVGETTGCTDKLSLASPQIKEIPSLSERSPAKGGSPWVRTETVTQPNPLQSDPFPPYDPKVNYLSPRPQFLRYKPKPQADLRGNELDSLEMNSDPRSLEESFSSECSDDSISVQTEEEDNLSEEATLPQIELQPSRVTNKSRANLKTGHLLLVLLIGFIFLPLSDSPMTASYSNPKFAGFHTRLLEVSSKVNGWLPDCFSYLFAREASFSRERNTFVLSNLTCVVDDKESSTSEEYKMETVSEEKETKASFEMVQRENEVLEVQTRFEIGNIEEEEEKEFEADAGSILEQQHMETSSTISNKKEDAQPELEKSEPEKPKNPEPELVENQQVQDPEAIMTENPEPKLSESESDNMSIMTENPEPKLSESKSDNMSGEELIKISKRAAQGMASAVLLLSLVTAVAATTFAKKKQNQVLDFDSTRGDKLPGMVQNSTLDEISSSSIEVDKDGGTYTSTPRQRQARRESDASSCSYGSYVSFEKVSSKKGNREGEEITPVRRSSRLRSLTIAC
ncbi:hypothetical protein FCM35_KLT01451 [Carex littledalei]|uniref:Uncharacterized protein n=1 Tax=Carex littledalei TaxID=544730 RepID=A0A833QVP4_9POAL|nr:hypothetical protein FCM35_KLT01451 [Carex littledalei]